MQVHVHQETYKRMLAAALFINAKNYKYPMPIVIVTEKL